MAVPALADHFIELECEQDVVRALSIINTENRTDESLSDCVLVLGEGSNLVLNNQFRGWVLWNQIKGVEVLDENDSEILVKVGGGENWHKFVQTCLDNGWYGLENLSLIPGTVGASPVQNIGAYGVEVKEFIEQVTFVELKSAQIQYYNSTQCEFEYRESVFKTKLRNQTIITHVTFRLSKVLKPNLTYGPLQDLMEKNDLSAQEISDRVVEVRKSKLPDPNELPNAGSFFKNPVVDSAQHDKLISRFPDIVSYSQSNGELFKIAAGWLIDNAGWKGFKKGSVGVHDKQALVLVNRGGKGSDILNLAEDIKSSILDKYGVSLEIEPRIY